MCEAQSTSRFNKISHTPPDIYCHAMSFYVKSHLCELCFNFKNYKNDSRND